MQNAFILPINVCAWWIAIIYPFIAVLRGETLSGVVKKSWGSQIVYFTFLCLLLPTIGDWYIPGFGGELAILLPDGPAVTAVAVLGWAFPLLSGSTALFIRRLSHTFLTISSRKF